MLKTRLTLLFVLIAFSLNSFAEPPKEGMWLPQLLKSLNESDMQSMGMKLTAEDIYSVNKSSLKDAIVHFGGGCTGSIISDDGLLLTNHHCGFYYIQQRSTMESDYTTDGFWAMNKKDELANPGLSATFIVRIEDVTDKVLDGVSDDTDPAERDVKINSAIRQIEGESVEGTHYKAKIKPFFYGNEYYMFVTETFQDIRLVGAPHYSIGKFGGDTDNWMWPRHTADFALFRVYAGPDNKPAPYSADNKPYKPKYSLPISMKGVQKDDFTMVFGFPGRTEEYLTSYAVEHIYNDANPERIAIREKRLDIISKYMKRDNSVRMKYIAKYNSISNYHKKWIGENRGLKKLDAINKKKEMEGKFQQWADGSEKRKVKYSGLLSEYKRIYSQMAPLSKSRDYVNEAMFGSETILLAYRMSDLVNTSLDPNKSDEDVAAQVDRAKRLAGRHFKDYYRPVDREVMKAMLKMYYNNTDRSVHPDIFSYIEQKFNGDFNKYVDNLFEKSVLVTPDKLLTFLNNYKRSQAKKLVKDPAFQLSGSVINNYREKIAREFFKLQGEIDELNRSYVKGLRTMMPEKTFYPDANSTMRIAYGKVADYYPADGVYYKYYTTADGILEKWNDAEDDFKLDSKLVDLFQKKDYGPYADKSGDMRICFTASNHTTGGNSGSPVIDGEGRLIGLNFDRAWESTMSDIMYDPERCRNISVDIRYVLFIMDKYAGAKHLVDELTLVK